MKDIVLIGTAGMLLFALGVIVFVLIHQRRVIRYQVNLQKLREEQQKLLLHAAITSEEQERHRIADELHDEVGASLAAIRLFMRQVPERIWPAASPAREALDGVIGKVRSISHKLSPEMLTRFGLREALHHTVQQLADSGVLKASFKSFGNIERMEPARELAVYRIIQELLANLMKHAGASEIRLEVSQRARQLVVTLEDDGKGFSQDTFEALKSSAGGLGLKNIQSRLDILQANINFTARRSGRPGTTACLEIPLAARTEDRDLLIAG